MPADFEWHDNVERGGRGPEGRGVRGGVDWTLFTPETNRLGCCWLYAGHHPTRILTLTDASFRLPGSAHLSLALNSTCRPPDPRVSMSPAALTHASTGQPPGPTSRHDANHDADRYIYPSPLIRTRFK